MIVNKLLYNENNRWTSNEQTSLKNCNRVHVIKPILRDNQSNIVIQTEQHSSKFYGGLSIYNSIFSKKRKKIAYAVSQVARINADAGQLHWKSDIKIFWYMQGTLNMGIKFSSTPYMSELLSIKGYVNRQDYDRCVDTRRSITAYMLVMSNGRV